MHIVPYDKWGDAQNLPMPTINLRKSISQTPVISIKTLLAAFISSN